MTKNTVPTPSLMLTQIPDGDACVEDLIRFAQLFEACGEVEGLDAKAMNEANLARFTINQLRGWLAAEGCRWLTKTDCSEEAKKRMSCLVSVIRERLGQLDGASPEWLSEAIGKLPSDESVPRKTQGYNVYRTQKAHWLGWLNPAAGTGTYPRRSDDKTTARMVYNRIGEPKMLLWLISAAQVPPKLVAEARQAAEGDAALSSRCASIRKLVPWRIVADALFVTTGQGASADGCSH